jgi:hypothetical protein
MAASDLSEIVTVMKAIQSLAETLRVKLEPYPEESKNMDVENLPDSAVIRDAVLLAHWEAQLYKNEQYTDIYDFCTLLKARLPKRFSEVRGACQNVLNAIAGVEKQAKREGKEEVNLASPEFHAKFSRRGKNDDIDPSWMDPVDFRKAKGFILKSCYSGWAVQYSYGVSVYFPWSEVPADMESMSS